MGNVRSVRWMYGSIGLVWFTQVAIAAQLDEQARLDFFNQTKWILVSDFKDNADEFAEDSDAMTVQIVLLSDKKQGKSHVSANGQVIFMRVGDEAKSNRLIADSFEKRIQKL